MRFVTARIDGLARPCLEVDAQTILDLTRAFEIARGAGIIDDAVEAPKSLLDVVVGGDSARRICDILLLKSREHVLEAARHAVSNVAILATIPRPLKNVFCVGSNYRAHVSEANKAQGKSDVAPDRPVFFTKPPTAVIGPDDVIRLDAAVSEKMDYEVELGIVFGKAGRNIRAENALEHIFGFTIINDVTARDLQRAHGGQFLKGKGLDTTCPIGPSIVTLDELRNFDNLRISLTVNGETRQDGNTNSLIFSIPTLVESLSEGMTLEPGDLLATGTPSGVGYAMDPPNFLKDGDVVTCDIEGIGQLTNVVRDVSKVASAA